MDPNEEVTLSSFIRNLPAFLWTCLAHSIPALRHLWDPWPESFEAKPTNSYIARVPEETLPDGHIRTKNSVYETSALDAISFDPFILQAEQSHDAARSEGKSGLARLEKEAWMEERLTEASIRKLKSRQALLEEQQRTAEAGQRLRRSVREENMDERKQAALPVPKTPPALTHTPMRPSLTDEQIEGIALRAMMEGITTEQEWQPYKEALQQHLAPFTVQEIEDHLKFLWKINPDGPQLFGTG